MIKVAQKMDLQSDLIYSKKTIIIAVIVFLVAFLPRSVCYLNENVSKDDCYWDLSLSIRNSMNYKVLTWPPQTKFDRLKAYYFDNVTTGHRVPATPIFLAITGEIFHGSIKSIQFTHAILTSLVSVLMFMTLNNLSRPKAGVVAGIIWAFWPYSIFWGHYLSFMSEPIALYCISILLFMSTLQKVTLKLSVITGLVIGISILNRSEYFIFSLVYVCALIVKFRKWRKHASVIFLVAFLVVSPWIIRNYVVFGRPVMTTLSGFAQWLGNNPWTYGTCNSNDSLDDPQMIYVSDRYPDLWEVDELTRSDYFKKATRDYLIKIFSSNPRRVIELYGSKLIYFFLSPTFLSDTWDDLNLKGKIIELLVTLSTTLFKALFVFFCFTKKKDETDFFFLFPMAIIAFVSLAIFPGVRYEYPYDIAMIMFVSLKLEPSLSSLFAKFGSVF
jgi:hypothetical protein